MNYSNKTILSTLGGCTIVNKNIRSHYCIISSNDKLFHFIGCNILLKLTWKNSLKTEKIVSLINMAERY